MLGNNPAQVFLECVAKGIIDCPLLPTIFSVSTEQRALEDTMSPSGANEQACLLLV